MNKSKSFAKDLKELLALNPAQAIIFQAFIHGASYSPDEDQRKFLASMLEMFQSAES